MAIQQKGNKKIFITAISGIIFLGIFAYVGGMTIFPNLIISSYENKDCAKIREYHGFVLKIYPFILQNHPEFVDYLNECDLFMNASAEDDDQDWSVAHNLYQAYETKYVSGIFIDDVRSLHAALLIDWALELKSRNEYDQALATANIVVEQYGNTPSYADAFNLIHDILLAWGTELRVAEKFDDAESKFLELAKLAKLQKSNEYEKRANEELSETYLAWGNELMSANDFESAQIKFEQAVQLDADVRTQGVLQNLHMEWAEQLLIENNYLEAIKHVELAKKIKIAETQAKLDDLLLRLYIRWAISFAEKEDYFQAFDKLNEIESEFDIKGLEEQLASSRQEIYSLFSNSDGEQAQMVMAEAAEKICNRQEVEWPIFGTDPNNIKAFLFPLAEDQLSDEVRATTPSSMHYVACVTEVVTSKKHSGNLAMVLRDGPDEDFTLEEFKFFWDIILRRVSNGEMVDEQRFSGGNPPKRPNTLVGGYNARYGARPNVEVTISAWLKKYLK